MASEEFCQFGYVTPPPKRPFEERDGWQHHAPSTNLDDSRWLNPAALPPKIYPSRPVRASRSTSAAEEGDAIGGSNEPEEKTTADNSNVLKKDVKTATPADDAQSRIQAARERFLARKGNK
ncbi:hypothetical protein Tco_0925395 [Tanacetum coccineum]|uniref:Uncharacterized protein n=1 Tax=Tanacetum coccineum TaxID=301880 RepID=A0ABQ5D6P5_9ASTR